MNLNGSRGELSNCSSGMHHSLSTPIGVDSGARTPPSTPRKYGKMLAFRVQMLDDSVTIFQVQSKALGKVLFEQVCKQLHLLEADYFGLEYQDSQGTKYWLDLEKAVCRQLGLSLVDPLLYFCVKFYTPDPSQLEEEFTRYLFCLQVKRDLAEEHLKCNEKTTALMISYIVQAESGDFVPEDYPPDRSRFFACKYVPNQDEEMERNIMENYKKHSGQSPAEADVNLLETARRCELYGIKMHPAKDHDNVPLNLAVAHMGIIVFQHYTKINTFSWAKIRKISFKRKRFLIKLHPEGYGYYKDIVEFFFEGRNECKNFWKKCVENHAFFRCASVKTVPRQKTRVLSRGSSFRYSGKTQKEIVEFVRDNYLKRQPFQRSASFRHTSAHSSSANMQMHASSVGNSISAHPLLPLSDINISTGVEVTKRSASLASMEERRSSRSRKILDSPTTTKSASLPQGTVMSWNWNKERTKEEQEQEREEEEEEEDFVRTTTTTSITTSTATTTSSTILQSVTTCAVANAEKTISSAAPNIAATTSSTTNISVHLHPQQLHRSSETATGIVLPPRDTFDNKPLPLPIQTCYNFTYKSTNELGCVQNGNYDNCNLDNDDDENNFKAFFKRTTWLRSSSCRDLNDFSFEESGKTKRRHSRHTTTSTNEEENRGRLLDSPITRYQDSSYDVIRGKKEINAIITSSSSTDKIYSSSYPGTTTTTTSYDVDFNDDLDLGNYSQDDVTHDSYELILEEATNSSFSSGLHGKFSSMRSCSLDSGQYHPQQDEIESTYRCKSNIDLIKTSSTTTTAFDYDTDTDDPRYYPREKMPRKSDGSFYKSLKHYVASSSSFESSSFEKRTKGDVPFERNYKENSCKNIYDEDDVQTVPNDNDDDYNNEGEDGNVLERVVPQKSIFLFDEDALQFANYRKNVQFINKTKNKREEIFQKHLIDDDDYRRKSKESFDKKVRKKSLDSLNYDKKRLFNLDDCKSEMHRKSDLLLFHPIQHQKQQQQQQQQQPQNHQLIERTKSDPNSLARRQRLGSGSKRHLLMHQKSIDITPCESSDDDFLYRQIPSAPPITTHCVRSSSYFDMMPQAEFGHFDVLNNDFNDKREKRDQDVIPYTLHKRHVMNGTAPVLVVEQKRNENEDENENVEKIEENDERDEGKFLFTQNVDLSKINPITLEITDKGNKNANVLLSSPKRERDITTRIDPQLLETLNSKLSQIESDSPNSTESCKPKKKIDKNLQTNVVKLSLKENKQQSINKLDGEKKRTTNKKSNVKKKTKVRITSFSSDDESLDSDDVFGSAEATPTKLEFSPPQTRKEMESILKFEAERKYLQYTMSSTEVEGSPPATRKTDLSSAKEKNLEVVNFQTELRRISERSFSIPSSEEDDLNMNTSELHSSSVFQEITTESTTLTTVMEVEKALLFSQIEEDLQNLKVPLKTKITEISPGSTSTNSKTPSLLFVHARLNLSEGSAISLLQKQKNNLEINNSNSSNSTMGCRRAKSLDTPVISIHNLPPSNAFSSKDDTVENYSREIILNSSNNNSNGNSNSNSNSNSGSSKLEKDQIVPNLVKRARSQEEGRKTTNSLNNKEKARSVERMRSKSQEDSDTDVAKRKEKQQMLYETAIKQTKNLKSPVKDLLPVFPQVEESVRERGGKLEISINTIEDPNVSLEEAIIITKSPKRLDKKLITKSLELITGNDHEKIERLGKSLDLQLDDNNTNTTNDEKDSNDQFDFDVKTVVKMKNENVVILEGTSLDVWLSVEEKNRNKQMELEKEEKLKDITVIRKCEGDFFEEGPKPPLGASLNNLDYIDDDSGGESTNDELQKNTKKILTKYLTKKIEKRRRIKQQEQEQQREREREEEQQQRDEGEIEEKYLNTKIQLEYMKRSSSDTASSWTSGEKDLSPSLYSKEQEESSQSCAMGSAIGISTTIEKFADENNPKSPRSPKISLVGRGFTIDEESYGLQQKEGEELSKYPFEEKWSDESELGRKVQMNITNKLLLSTDSTTESTSNNGLKFAKKLIKDTSENSNKKFQLESSGSSSVEEFFVSATKVDEDVVKITNDVVFTTTSSTVLLNRTLSRISERSTNSDRSSLEEDSTRASTHLDSLNEEEEEEIGQKQRGGDGGGDEESLSTDSPVNARKSDEKQQQLQEQLKQQQQQQHQRTYNQNNNNNLMLLQRQISDDRRTSAEMAELSIDDIEIITSECQMGLLKRQNSDDTVIEEDEDEDEDEEWRRFEEKKTAAAAATSSQEESDEWPLPDIPKNATLFNRRSSSLKSQEDSEKWPTPPSSVLEQIVETSYVTPQQPRTVLLYEYDDGDDDEDDDEQQQEQQHLYENLLPLKTKDDDMNNESSNLIQIIVDEGSSEEDENEDDDDVFVDVTTETVKIAGTTNYSNNKCCTHSSHSEDTTSIGFSLSEWSFNTVKQQQTQNFTTSTTTTTTDDNSSMDLLPSISDATNMVNFQKLSSSTGDSNTLTFTEKSTASDSNSKTLIAGAAGGGGGLVFYGGGSSSSSGKKAKATSTERPVSIPIFNDNSKKTTTKLSSSKSAGGSNSSSCKNATVPLTRSSHRSSKSSKSFIATLSENDSTSSSLDSTSIDTKRRKDTSTFRRKKQKHNSSSLNKEKFINDRKFLLDDEGGYVPDGDSQSGSDIFKMENENDYDYNNVKKCQLDESFDVDSIPPPLLEQDDYNDDHHHHDHNYDDDENPTTL